MQFKMKYEHHKDSGFTQQFSPVPHSPFLVSNFFSITSNPPEEKNQTEKLD